MKEWDAGQYLRFKQERTQPAIDLAAQIPLTGNLRILDAGCGPGNSTRVLAQRFPQADILGVDSSPEMIRRARQDHPDLCFALGDISCESWPFGGPFDVIFSNACLQWVPEHTRLLPHLLAQLAPGGVLAVQVPMNYDEPIHRILGALAEDPAWRDKFSHRRRFYTLTPEGYYAVLTSSHAQSALWQTTYIHVMPSYESILEWYRGTGMRPYLEQLSAEDGERFAQQVLERVREAYPIQPDGKILFRFPRLFFLARV